MPRGRPRKKADIQEFLDSYDDASLIASLNSFEGSLGWDLLKSFLYYQASFHAGAALVLAQQTGRQFEAASAGAKAEVLREAADNFLPQLRSKVAGNEGVVEDSRPLDTVLEKGVQ